MGELVVLSARTEPPAVRPLLWLQGPGAAVRLPTWMAVSCGLDAVTTVEANRRQESRSCPSLATLTCTAACRVRSPLAVATRKPSERSIVLPELPWASKQVTADGPVEGLASTTLAVTMYEPTGTRMLVTCVGVEARETDVEDRPNWAVNPAEGPAGP